MQKLFKIYLALFICLLFFAPLVVKGSTPVVHFSVKPTWLSAYKDYNQKPSLRTIERGFFYALIEQQIQVEKQAHYHHVIKEIVSETGIQNASQISISFDPAFERLDFHNITIWRDNKPINRLKTSAFKVIADEEDLSNFIYQGSFSALCILDDIRKGDRIEYDYTITGRNPIFNGKFCDDIYFQWYQPIAHQYTAIITSSQRKLNFKPFNKVPHVSITEGNGLKRYEYEDFQIPAARDDDSQPAWYNARGYVQISEYNDWAGVVNWALGINPTATNIKGELAVRIEKLKTAAGTDKEKYFREAVKTVQDEVRYMGIEIGQYSHRANNPEKVFKQRYGDCKDKSLLLVSMLKANDIEANMVLVNASKGSQIADYMPTYNAFNHAVVVANVNGKQVWVDATIDSQGGSGTDIYFPDYGKGLILKAGNTALTTIPLSKKGKIISYDIYKIKDVKSPVLFTVKTIYTLNQADDIRSKLASSGMAETEKSYLDYYSKIYSKIEAKDSIVVIDDLQKNTLTTTETYLITNFLKKDTLTDNLSVDLFAGAISQQFPSFTGQTKTPVSVTYPYDLEYTQQVILPLDWTIDEKSNTINRDYYRFASHYFTSGDTLMLNYKFAYLKDYVPVDKLAEFKDDIKRLNDTGLGYGFIYTPGVTSGSSKINGFMVLFACIFTMVLIYSCIWIYRRETPAIVFSYGSTFKPIGGWLILIAIGLAVAPLTIGASFFKNDYFSLTIWNYYASTKHDFVFKCIVLIDILGNIVLIIYAVFCLILLLNKRDILPKAIIGFMIFNVVFLLVDYWLSLSLNNNTITEQAERPLVITFIKAAIWIPYFLRSTRVGETFIVPYPSYNYSYEEPEKQVEAPPSL
jgi:transglutaminase-like putative cysteine protease